MEENSIIIVYQSNHVSQYFLWLSLSPCNAILDYGLDLVVGYPC